MFKLMTLKIVSVRLKYWHSIIKVLQYIIFNHIKQIILVFTHQILTQLQPIQMGFHRPVEEFGTLEFSKNN